MKKFQHKTFVVLLAFAVQRAAAYDCEVDGIYYNLDGTTASVTNKNTSYSYSGNIVIPESITYEGNAYSVTSIGDWAFAYCSGLISVTIPNSVTTIGYYAFENCSGLTSITIGNSVTTIGSGAFISCYGLTSVHISDLEAWCKIKNNTSESNPLFLAHHLFLNDQEVKDLVIPNSVTSIGDWAFEGCTGLTSVTIPNSVTTIGNGAFYVCSGLTSVTIPNSVTSIGYDAFLDCI